MAVLPQGMAVCADVKDWAAAIMLPQGDEEFNTQRTEPQDLIWVFSGLLEANLSQILSEMWADEFPFFV